MNRVSATVSPVLMSEGRRRSARPPQAADEIEAAADVDRTIVVLEEIAASMGMRIDVLKTLRRAAYLRPARPAGDE